MRRVCYLSPGAFSSDARGSAERQHRQSFLNQRCGEGVRVQLCETAGGPPSIETEAEEQQAAAAIEETVPRMEAEGFDVLIVGCFGDPALAAARRIVEMPVIGGRRRPKRSKLLAKPALRPSIPRPPNWLSR